MRDILRAVARFATAIVGVLALMCSRDSTGPIDWTSALRGAWTGELHFHPIDRPDWNYYLGFRESLSAVIDVAPDGRISGCWSLAETPPPSCASDSNPITGLITSQTVDLTLTTSQGSNLFLLVSHWHSCDPASATAAPSATGEISRDSDGTTHLHVHDAADGLQAEFTSWVSGDRYCVPIAGVWSWFAHRLETTP